MRQTFTAVFLACDHFWTGIASRPAPCIHQLSLLRFSAEPEICEFYVASLVQKHVLEFEVAVHDSLGVYFSDSNAELAKDAPSLLLIESPAFDKIVKEFSAGTKLRDEPYVRFRSDNLIELDNMAVVKTPMMMYLAGENRVGLRSGDLFHGATSGREAMGRKPDLTKRPCFRFRFESAGAVLG
jgi:hypothetical protein